MCKQIWDIASPYALLGLGVMMFMGYPVATNILLFFSWVILFPITLLLIAGLFAAKGEGREKIQRVWGPQTVARYFFPTAQMVLFAATGRFLTASIYLFYMLIITAMIEGH